MPQKKKKFDPDSAGEETTIWLYETVKPSYQRDQNKRSAQRVSDPDTFNPKMLGRPTVALTPEGQLHDGDSLLVDEADGGKPVYDIIDGLQRLTGLLALFGPNTQVKVVLV